MRSDNTMSFSLSVSSANSSKIFNISTFSLNTAIPIGVVPQRLDSVQNANAGWSPHVKYKSDPSSTGFAYGSALEGNEKIHGASCFEKIIAKTNKLTQIPARFWRSLFFLCRRHAAKVSHIPISREHTLGWCSPGSELKFQKIVICSLTNSTGKELSNFLNCSFSDSTS